jgi:hypothetical protein
MYIIYSLFKWSISENVELKTHKQDLVFILKFIIFLVPDDQNSTPSKTSNAIYDEIDHKH